MNVAAVALAGLLHEIGQMVPEGNRQFLGSLGKPATPSENLGEPSAEASTSAPESSHQNVDPRSLSVDFVRNLPFLPPGIDREELEALVLAFHWPASPLAPQLYEAHRLAAGLDPAVEEESSTLRPSSVHALSIAALVGKPQPDNSLPAWMPIAPLHPAEAFPILGELPPREVSLQAWKHLWDQFCHRWAENRCPDPLDFVDRAGSILERFAWCLPAAPFPLGDVSLFDHAKVTAALAVCLAWEGVDPEKPFLLVGADLAGIQKYLFDLREGTGGIARRLRARSFKVAAYTDGLSIAILRRLGLPLTQRLLFAGGKFVLLLPNSPEVQARLNEIRTSVAGWVFRYSVGEVTLSLATLPATRDDLRQFPETWGRLNAALRMARAQPGHEVLTHQSTWNEEEFVLPPVELGENEVRCPSCRRRKAEVASASPDSPPICSHCRDEENLGAILPRCRYVVYYTEDPNQRVIFGDSVPTPIGRFLLADDHFLSLALSLLAPTTSTPDSTASSRPVVLDLDGTLEGPSHACLIGGFRSRYVPRDPETGAVVDFASLARQSQGRPLIACLKMDADNLGYIFSEGLHASPGNGTGSPVPNQTLPKNPAPPASPQAGAIARVASLSRILEVFFSGYIEELLRQKYSNIYLVYSGGDDLVAVGPWDRILDFAAEIREAFRRFTAGNPLWSLSAGVAVTNPHVPVLLVIEEADRLLEISKSIAGSGVLPYPAPAANHAPPQKDRITVLGTSIPWNQFPTLVQEGKQLARWIADRVVSTAQVYRLLYYAGLARKFQQTRDTQYLQYIPYLVRDLRRNWSEKTPEHKAAKIWATQFIELNNPAVFGAWFICQYALYASRSSE
jgi:CRISPR-associated protein Csm1